MVTFWGYYTDLTEVLALAGEGRIKHTVTPVELDDINARLETPTHGDAIGRQVGVFA
ncbi:hypothetical protein [Streptomyces sp. NBC_00878]|uniref:hypothetical protein n=1 Tax=Streptomyces sp. NBC_00878 TaxID=2975854 RepID=UPI002257B639|nr:hypothetical protein [Streptomyces sp. NBC_00878]MCX4906300.1 hypothetical protein [Streptomyces sp. NBC_00878]WSY54181.1 hypothetical protein OG999_31360 [Streptomyces sp. NBC_00886]